MPAPYLSSFLRCRPLESGLAYVEIRRRLHEVIAPHCSPLGKALQIDVAKFRAILLRRHTIDMRAPPAGCVFRASGLVSGAA